MCGVCGLLDSGPQWSDALQNDLPQRQLRLKQLALLNRTLKPWRLTLTEFHASWVLSSPTGQQVMVNSLDLLWKEVEKITKRPLDPLDEAWLAAL
ncbi:MULTISPECIES: hypothetical protein [Pantoea]|uniref:Uncharacterized protein n=1 Tax=Pantoea stewartii subsp. stewartii DC283 TaxID=660596 RepID=H3RCU4_PANSE|nr:MULTISPECIES: hypothetical protein [Pantoea]ARF50307.1 hypothetical protein DSJ_13845 [Pantoea stewartii subsp. stewartii DC283]EHU00804.1 hypothetical protein CKS_2935 [Pantoea stewartii subsp. stewartii DC283]KAB0552297.1 hypothetical protein F7Q90_15270 [Pantoea stewartii subsp. stewartii]KGD81059.1 hypothetical protein HA47_19115 [Pantoea stewartii subsp. indologenes]KHE02361.1 hypothetical protein NL54_06450 [Pantoea stewartii]